MDTYLSISDILIIGGGPTGLFAAFYAGMRQASVTIVESLHQLGGQPAALYPEKYIYDIPTQPAISGHHLSVLLQEQLKRFEPTICLGEEVTALAQQPDGAWLVHTTRGTHLARSIILATGNGSFQPRKLDVPQAAEFENRGISYFVSSIAHFANRTVAICGGGDSAVDWALSLSQVAKKVYLIHRRTQFRAHEHAVQQLHHSSVAVYTPYIIQQVHGDAQGVTGLTLNEVRTPNTLHVPIDDVLVQYGFVSSLSHLKQWGLTLERQGIPVTQQMATNLSGVFAIGDCSTYPGKTKLIATGFGEAPVAVAAALDYIYPERRQPLVHSTSLFEQPHSEQ